MLASIRVGISTSEAIRPNLSSNHIVVHKTCSTNQRVCYRLLGESARWLMSRGRMEECSREVKRAARMNRTAYPDTLMKKQQEALVNAVSMDELMRAVRTCGPGEGIEDL